MSHEILNKYKIKFEVTGWGRSKLAMVSKQEPDLKSYCLCGFFKGNDVGMLKTSLLCEIDKCLQGEEYDGEWIGNLVDLQFDASTATLSDESKKEGELPLVDFREIVALWIEWVEKNKLEQKIL